MPYIPPEAIRNHRHRYQDIKGLRPSTGPDHQQQPVTSHKWFQPPSVPRNPMGSMTAPSLSSRVCETALGLRPAVFRHSSAPPSPTMSRDDETVQGEIKEGHALDLAIEKAFTLFSERSDGDSGCRNVCDASNERAITVIQQSGSTVNAVGSGGGGSVNNNTNSGTVTGPVAIAAPTTGPLTPVLYAQPSTTTRPVPAAIIKFIGASSIGRPDTPRSAGRKSFKLPPPPSAALLTNTPRTTPTRAPLSRPLHQLQQQTPPLSASSTGAQFSGDEGDGDDDLATATEAVGEGDSIAG
jgi:hypothetical protein